MINKLTAYIKDLLEAKIALAITGNKPLGIIKTVYNGEPFSYPEASLPALAIEVIDSAYKKTNTKYEATWRIRINAKITQKTTYWIPQDDRTDEEKKEYNETVTIKKLIQEIMEGSPDDACQIDWLSLFGIFRGLTCLVDNNWCVLANEVFISSVSYTDYSQQRSFIAYEWSMELVLYNAQLVR